MSRRPQDRPGDGEGRGRLPALRAVRRTLSHRRLGHAEIPPRYDSRRFIMPEQKPISSVNDFVVKFANVNGSGSASANEMFARSILRMGVPVSPRNIFPSNIQGLPTWYEVRVTEAGHLGAARRRRPDGGDEPADLGQGRRLDRARRLSVLQFDQADADLEIPRRHQRDRRAADRDHQLDLHRSAPAPAVQEHHLSRRAVRAARHGPEADRAADRRAVQGQGKADRLQRPRAASRPRLGAAEPEMPDRPAGEEAPTRSATASSSRATARPRSARSMAAPPSAPGIRSRRRPRWPTPSPAIASSCGTIPRPARPNTPSSRARTSWPRSASSSARPGTARAPSPHLRPRHLADDGVHRAGLFRRNPGRDHQRAARRPLDRHADAHPAIRHRRLRLCLARRHQACAAVPGGSGRSLRVRRHGLRSRRAAADRDLRDARPRHRHERLAVPAASSGTTRGNTTAARS